MEAPRWFDNWKLDALRRVEDLRNKWRREREKLDLELETTPIESKFSSELVRLMNNEDELASQGDFRQHEMIAQKADELLGKETSKHFRIQANINMKKMSTLFRQQVLERDQFFETVKRQFAAICESANQPPISDDVINERMMNGHFAIDPSQEFAAEERRLWRVAQQEMPKAERFHIANAFALQLERVDVEWSAHEEQMKQDYAARRSRIQGRDVERTTVQTPVGRWKSKEKQSRLIHTAPVQEPSSQISMLKDTQTSSEAKVRGDKKSRPQSKAQQKEEVAVKLAELEQSYNEAKLRMKFEKQSAKRFIERQSLRMNAQIDAMAKCKHFLGMHLEEEETALTSLLLRLACFSELILETNSLPLVLRVPQTNPQSPPSSSSAAQANSSSSKSSSSNSIRPKTTLPKLAS